MHCGEDKIANEYLTNVLQEPPNPSAWTQLSFPSNYQINLKSPILHSSQTFHHSTVPRDCEINWDDEALACSKSIRDQMSWFDFPVLGENSIQKFCFN